ncbi:MAG: mercury(II) reductase [Methanoregulaceae archaeon]|nr:mercury(II) reductase [Methanoregulaceae archaeon]
MEHSRYDLVIIGTGAAGTSAAARAVNLGARHVAIVEQGRLFGTCINVGCIPSKYLLAVANIHYYRGHGYPGLEIKSRYDSLAALAGKDTLLGNLRRRKEEYLFERLGVDLIRGMARFTSPDEIIVEGRTIRAERFVIATGSRPSVPDIDGISSVPFMTSDEALDPDNIPENLIVIGGRAIGLELAQLYAHLGSKVTVLQRSHLIIPEEEPDISRLLAKSLMTEGIRIETGTELKKLRSSDKGILVSALIRGDTVSLPADRILMATGRDPDTRGLNLETAGVKTGARGAVLVDDSMKTSSPRIWAAGDVIGDPQLEPVAGMGGSVAAENALTGSGKKLDLSAVPHAIYTMPQVASVGLTEAGAEQRGLLHECRSISLDRLGISAISGSFPGLVKIVAGKDQRTILGMHICAPAAAEMIHEGVCAVKFGISVDDIIDMIHVFPTFTGAIQVCARSFRKDMPEKEGCD